MCKSVSAPILGLCSENLSVVVRGIGFIRSQTRRSATTSTIAEAQPIHFRPLSSTTYRLKHSRSMWSQQFAVTGKRICLQFYAILNHEPGTAFNQCVLCFLEKTSLGCLTVCLGFPPEKPTLNRDVDLIRRL